MNEFSSSSEEDPFDSLMNNIDDYRVMKNTETQNDKDEEARKTSDALELYRF